MEQNDNYKAHVAKQQAINEQNREKKRHIGWIIALAILNLIALLLLFLLPYNCRGCTHTEVIHDTIRVREDVPRDISEEISEEIPEETSEEEEINDAVEDEGGNTNGFMRFSILWNKNYQEIVDLDAHAEEPNGAHIFFQRYCRTSYSPCGGQLDVDMVESDLRNPDKKGAENIVWASADKLDDGNYTFGIHNYSNGRFNECDILLKVGNKSWHYKVSHFGNRHPGRVDTSDLKPIAVVTIKNHQFYDIKHIVQPVN